MPKDYAMKFLNAVYTGKDKYDLFIKERLIGEKSIWDTITKEKIPTFAFNNKEITIIVNKELVNIQEERKLMSRFLVALRSRHDIDLSCYLSEFELSFIPRSLFTVDGCLHKTTDKSVVASELRKFYTDENSFNESINDPSEEKVIIFDGTAIVNKITSKKSKIKTFADFAVVERILDESFGYDEVRVVFDRYVQKSLKTQTRISKTKVYSTVYRVMDKTKMDDLETKSFLSSIKAKNDLRKYLSNKLANVFSERPIPYVTVYGTTCDTYIQDLDPTLFDHSQEEADRSIILHAIDVTQRNPFSDLVIRCSDADVLLILLYYFDELCSTTIFSTNEHDMPLQLLAKKLNFDLRKGLLGFHALTESDQTEKFFGYSKLSCWETYLACSLPCNGNHPTYNILVYPIQTIMDGNGI